MLDTGQTVDRYTVDSIIGYGGTAVVYLVKHVQLSTQHALKVLSVSSGAIRERMLREGRVQAALTHPNVVAVSDVLDVDGSPGLLMEYIEGPSLEEALKQFRISLEDAETLFRGIVLGVHAAHETGLVHRDLKPANVLLAESEEGFVPKVTDFGLAKVIVGDGIEVGTTRAGIAMGTPSYMSPEQIRDARKVDQRADIFSLGCLLYELVTGQRTFPGDEALTIYNAVTAGEYLPVEQLVPELPSRIVQCVDGCLALDREERIPNCATILEVLSGQKTWSVSSHPIPTEAIVERLHDDIPLMPVAGPYLDDDLTADEPIGMADDLFEVSEDIPKKSNRSGWAIGIVLSALVLLMLMGGGLYIVSQWLQPVAVAVNASSETVNLTPEQPRPMLPASKPTIDPSPAALDIAVGEDIPVTEEATPAVSESAKAKTTPASVPEPRIKTTTPRAPSHKPSPRRKRPGIVAVQKEVKLLSAPPNAALLVDGKELGRTNKKSLLTTGTHRVIVTSGGQEGSFTISVTKEGTNKWCYDFASDRAINGSCPRR